MPVSVTRYRYHDHISERFAYAYADQIGAWCSGHHLALTGHMMKEPDLMSQTMALGEAKRDYPACIGYRFPWFEKYKRIEDYFARVYTALVRGEASGKDRRYPPGGIILAEMGQRRDNRRRTQGDGYALLQFDAVAALRFAGF